MTTRTDEEHCCSIADPDPCEYLSNIVRDGRLVGWCMRYSVELDESYVRPLRCEECVEEPEPGRQLAMFGEGDAA